MSIYTAIKQAYQQIGTPMEPDADPGAIEAALQLSGYTLGIDAGRLTATRDGHLVPVEPALRTLALQPQNAALFVLPVERVTKLSQLKTQARKSEYISKMGLAAFTRLVSEKR